MSMPPLDPDDPRLTAYALGESGEADRQAVEKFLAESAEARAEVEQTRGLARLLIAEYAKENEQYLAARPDPEQASNIIEFSTGRERRWRRAVIPAFKAAALLALTASLVYLTLRRPLPPTTMTTATLPFAEPPSVPMPPPGLVNRDSKDAPAGARAIDDSDSAKLLASDERQAAEPKSPATGSPGSPPAGTADQRTAGASELPLLAQASQTSRAAVLAPPTMRLDQGAPMRSAVDAAAAPAQRRPPDEQLAGSLVRIRSSTGEFFGGVVISADGLILSAASLPESTRKISYTLRLADDRELPATLERAEVVAGLHTLKVDAGPLRAVTLASNAPTVGAPLSVPSVDAQSGALAFSQARAAGTNPSGGGIRFPRGTAPPMGITTGFGFNSAGELLVLEQSIASAKALTRSKSTNDRVTPMPLLARPFTASERARLRHAIGREDPR